MERHKKKELIENFSLAPRKNKKNITFSYALSIMCVECKEGKELTMEMRGIKKQEKHEGSLVTALKLGLVVFFYSY